MQHLKSNSNNEHKINHIYENGKKLSMEKLMQKDKVWTVSLSNELGRVVQGVSNRITGTDTMEFIAKADVPRNKKLHMRISYATSDLLNQKNIECA